MLRTVVWITEALYSNETLKLDTENSTLGNDEDKSLEHTAGVVNAENCTITTDDSVNITDTTDSTNVQLLKYVVKQNETGSPGDKNSGHYKNALKRKRRATTGIFDPHPALATLPLRIIADDDFFSIPGDNVATTHKPVIKENLKATAPQVFPQFTLVPVLPPGYLERYNVSTEVNHPVVNKNSDASKPSKSSSKSKITHYYETKSDNENEPKHPKPKSNNFESGGSSINNKYNSELDDFENYERPYNSHPHKKMNNHKQIKQYINNENDDDDDNTSRVQDRTRDHFDTHSDKPKHSQNSYSHPYHNSESNSYEFAPKRIIKPSEDSKNVPYEEDHDDDENRDTYKTSKDGKANHISENNLSKKETNLNNDREQENGFIPETRSSEEENENTHFKDNKEVVHHTYDGNKHRKEDNFRPNAHISTSKNKLTAPLFKPNGYIVPDGPQKIHREEEDTVEDYDDQPVIPKSKLETKNLDEPEAHTHSETYDDDNSREYRNYPKSPEVNNHNVHQDSKTTNIQLDRYNIQKDANENIEAKSGGFKSQNMEDDTLPENEEPDTTKFRKTYNEHNSSDDNEDDEKPSLHYTERKPNYERANNAYSKPAAHASSEENYDDTEDKNESEILRENSERQEEYPKYRSSHTSENKESYPPATNIERHSKDTEENSNEDDSKENKSHNDYYSQKNSNERLEKTDNRDAEDDSEEHGQEKPLRQPYNLKLNINERFKQNPREGSDENVSSEDSDRIVSKSFSVNPIEAPVENKRHTSDTGSEEINNEDEDRDKPKLLYENFQSHDYPTRKPAAFSKGNEDSGNGNSKSSYIIKNNSEPDGKNGPGEFAEENYNGNNKAKISYETYHPSIDEHPKRIPTGFSKENQDNGKVNAKISFETFHPLNSEFPKPKSLEKYSGELNIKPTLSYETYHPPVNAAEYRKPDPTEPTHENLDKNGKAQISYETYHPQGNMYDNSQEILAEPELKFNQALITPVNPKVSYETYHPLVRSNEYSQPEVISKGNVEENARSIQPTQYFEIFSQAKSPTVLPNDHGNSQHDKSSYPSKEIQGKPPKKYKPKPIFYDYNSFNPYKNLYPGAVKKVPKLPMFYSKKHSELPELGIKDSQGNVKQQFERIPLNYMHDSQNPRKPKVQGNKLSYVNIPYTPKENENLSSKEDKEDVEGNKPSIKYKTDLDIKLDDLKLDLPEIKLPESVLLYDSEEKEQNDSSGDKTEKYKVKEEDSEEDEDAEEEPEEEPEEAAEEEEDEEENNHRPPPPRHDNNNSPKYSDYKSEDDLYGKFFNDNIDLYESFVQDHFNKKGTFAERSQDIIEDPVLKSTMQDVLRRVAKSTKEAEKSEDPKYGYKWILNYGRPL